MAELLKDKFNENIPRSIAKMILAVHPDFPSRLFLREALDGYSDLDLMNRGRKIAQALHKALPEDYPRALKILMHSIGPKLTKTEGNGMAPFFYLPHTSFIAQFGLDHFEPSLSALYELTQRFTAEFAIRPFIERYPAQTLKLLHKWSTDKNVHVRRLVSEGTRPRLPWAGRLREFQRDPTSTIKLLEMLKDDPDLYVRRSVANHLNDIGKDHPELLVEIAKRWLHNASENRKWIVRHALRSSIKRCDLSALKLMGFGTKVQVKINKARVTPSLVKIGDSVKIEFEISNTTAKKQVILVDFRIHYVKASGKTAPKVFKLKSLDLKAGEAVRFQKKISVGNLTTRKHYPGVHRIELILNGEVRKFKTFEIA